MAETFRIPPEIQPVVRDFIEQQQAFMAGDKGQALRLRLTQFAHTLSEPPQVHSPVVPGPAPADEVAGWLGRLPTPLVELGPKLVPDPHGMEPSAAQLHWSRGLQVLDVAANALVGGSVPDSKFPSQAIVHAAFGTDDAARLVREPLFDPLKELARVDAERLFKLVVGGTLYELLDALREAGWASRQTRDGMALTTPFGRVTSLNSQRVCAGDTLLIGFAGFGSAPPQQREIVVSLPTDGSCVHMMLRTVAPGLYEPGGWLDSGQISLSMPEGIHSGVVGFLAVVPAPPGLSAQPGRLTGAAGMFQSMLGKAAGATGIQIGQRLVDLATRVEAGRFHSKVCASGPADGPDHLLAGLPSIRYFRAVEAGPVYPRGSVTLEWATNNAERVRLDVRDVAGSEHPHEWPAEPALLPDPLPPSGRVTVPVTCTRRWEVQLVLQAWNDNHCQPEPVESSVVLRSGFSTYLLGVARADITDARPGLGMYGFSYKGQRTSGNVQQRLHARAFVVEHNTLAPDRSWVAIVVADCWTCTLALKREVVARLQAIYGAKPGRVPQIGEDCILIAGTHTHAAPGGFSEYPLYNLTVGGFDQGVFDTMVEGIVAAIVQADRSKQPGRLRAIAGNLEGCGANRSMDAFRLNKFDLNGPTPFDPAQARTCTDREMVLLQFVADENNRGGKRPLGSLNWFAIHPTSLGMFNTRVSGDNKGHAELLFENAMGLAAPGFVAAFANGSLGDVSGNVQAAADNTMTVNRPLGGDAADGRTIILPIDRTAADWTRDLESMQALGERQYRCAHELYATLSPTPDPAPDEELGLPLSMAHAYVDMSDEKIEGQPGNRTWPAAVGVSFGAGSAEDSFALVTPDSRAPVDVNVAIPEGMNLDAMREGEAHVFALLLSMAPAVAAALSTLLATGAPLPVLLLPAVLRALAVVATPSARGFLAGKVGATMFPDEIADCKPAQADWRWNVPRPDNLEAAIVDGHAEKPIMFAVGMVTLAIDAGRPLACPLVPHMLPLQLLRIGTLAVAAVPAEFTTMAGWQLKKRIREAFGGAIEHVAVSCCSNGYSGYVTTREEYAAQHYEGASTLFGPHTLAAYLQVFGRLCAAVQTTPRTSTGAPFTLPAVWRKP